MLEGQFAVVVLAAGASSRLGRPKQLLPYLGTTLVEHATRAAIDSGAADVIVVVGSEAASVMAKLEGLPVRIVANDEWAEGMGSSVRTGMSAVNAGIECAVIALCDQPRITSGLLAGLAQKHFETGCPIVVSSYDGVIGAPAAFGSSQFAGLKALTGEQGARELIRTATFAIEKVEFDGGSDDIDTPADYQRLVPNLEEGPDQDG